MTPRTVAILACRIVALAIGIPALTAIASYLLTVRDQVGAGSFWAFVGPTVVAAFALWVLAEQLSVPMTRGADAEAIPAVRRSLANMHAIALTVVGILQIVEAIPVLFGILATESPRVSRFEGAMPFPFAGGFLDRGSAVLTQVVKIVVGLVLVAGSREIARRLAARYPDLEPPPPPEPS